MSISGHIAGYDPGGNDKHGLAIGKYEDGHCISIEIDTLPYAESVIDRLLSVPGLLALGVDTLVCWSTGRSGDRPADKWLRSHYSGVRNSIQSPNSLYGAMALSGASVISSLNRERPGLHITETHPKVLYYALSGEKYDATVPDNMKRSLSEWLGCETDIRNEHQFDAAISVYAAYKGLRGDWTRDLFDDKESGGEDTALRLICPAGTAHYWWPE